MAARYGNEEIVAPISVTDRQRRDRSQVLRPMLSLDLCVAIRGLLALAAAAVGMHATVATTMAADEAVERPNILFIAVDDLRPELGCYGSDQAVSPHLDSFAKTAVLFERAYCQLAVCNPSRVSVMTGMRPDTTRVWDLVTRFRTTVPNAVTLPQQLTSHGYTAISFGKIFHNPWPDQESWSEPHVWPRGSQLWSQDARNRLRQAQKKMRQDGIPKRKIDRLRPQATEVFKGDSSRHIDVGIAAQAREALAKLSRQERPFFLAAGFVRPHLPFVVPEKYWKLYERDAIRIAENQKLPQDAPKFAMNTMYELRDYVDFVGSAPPTVDSLSESEQRRLKHGYLASVSLIDDLIGSLLSELDRLGIADNTVVVIWSDHGWKLGEHNSWCKQTNYEIDTRVPLLIRHPGARGNGQRTRALVELLDLYPTVCELAGVPTPPAVEGQSLMPILDEPQFEKRDAAFSQFRRQVNGIPLMGYAVRSDRFRYIEWKNRRSGKVSFRELYDHSVDPNETTNISGKAGSAAEMKRLSELMWKRLPEPPEFSAVQPRPTIVFRNNGKAELTVSWLSENGQSKVVGTIKPGEQLLQNSTLGHRFRIQGPAGFERDVVVRRRAQTVVIAEPEL